MQRKKMKNYHVNNSPNHQFLGGQLGAGNNFSGNFAQGKRQRHRLVAQVLLAVIIGTCVATAIFALGTAKKPKEIVKTVVVEKEVAIKPQMKEVLIPIRTIKRGEQLKPEYFRTESRPATTIARDSVTQVYAISGKYAQNVIPANRPFPSKWAVDHSVTNPIVSGIKKGYRAVTINTNATSSVEGWARAGAHVDIHWIASMAGELSAKLLVENAKILSAERQADPNVDAATPIPTTVTLLTTGKDAQKISLASAQGSLVLHLRGYEDETSSGAPIGTLQISDIAGEKNYDNGKINVEGTVIVTGRNGEKVEMALINGKLQRKDKFVEVSR